MIFKLLWGGVGPSTPAPAGETQVQLHVKERTRLIVVRQ